MTRNATAAPGSSASAAVHEGVASCAGSTCHSRQVDSGVNVRQNELITWQDPSSVAGAHSRAYRVLYEARGQAIIRKMGLGPEGVANQCLGCHADPAPPGLRGARFQLSDGVGCEACHGGSRNWLASHRAVGGTHADNVARGMKALENPKVRAGVCLDCHFSGSKPGQFVSHEIMAAGHPRVAFELDLFSTLQQHWDVDADYVQRKGYAGGVKTWAVGQAMALERALTLYGEPGRNRGAFPELLFFDCHSCHRQISDDPKARPQWQANPGRPIPSGSPPFNDENMIMLAAAAKVVAPGLAARLEADSRAFHSAIARDRAESLRAAAKLAATSRALSDAFAARAFSRAETLAIVDTVLAGELARRYTDYAGSAQAVMAADTLLNALVASGQADRAAVARIRPSLDRAYAQVRDPNSYRPEAFRAALTQVAQGARSLR
ncbi:multiheme c-type cytochrome [Phenylobacterium sp. SCN 70-31]|uniref:multiheme c-type cytochrome n=1 Tax=Phenylobacterium sp. SCN 70-31 TaxID=1660129 RepID=UPI0025E68547|nr:multiheme c-type cytochrome [Phenylobacterium sp. SCN 70-31]